MTSSLKLSCASLFAVATCCTSSIFAQEPAASPMSAAELAGHIAATSQGSALIRTRLEVQSPEGKRVLQLQLKQRRTNNTTDVVYEVLWPNELKGGAVILHQSGNTAKGSIMVA